MEVNSLSLFTGCKGPDSLLVLQCQVNRTCPIVLKLSADRQRDEGELGWGIFFSVTAGRINSSTALPSAEVSR